MSRPLTTAGVVLPDPRDRNLDAAARALAAGLRTLLTRGDEVVADGLHRTRIAAVSGQSRQTLYQHFPDQQDYLDALIATILDPTHAMWQGPDLVSHIRDLVADQPTDSLGIVQALARHDFEGLRGDDHWRLVVLLWALAIDRPGVRTALGATWDHYNARTAAALDELLRHWNATLVPPWDSASAAYVFAALGEGLAMRASACQSVDAEIFANAVAAVAHAIVVPRDSDERFDPVLPQPEDDDGHTRPLDVSTVERVVATFIEHLERDHRTPSLGTLGREAGVAEAAVREHFGDADGVLIAAWRRFAADLGPTSHDPTAEPTLDRLRRRLESLLTVMAQCPALTGGLLSLCFRDPSRSTACHQVLDALAASFEDLLRLGRQTDLLSYETTPAILARHLVTTAATQSLAWPRPFGTRPPDPSQISDQVWSLTVGPLERR